MIAQLERVLIPEDEIAQRVQELGQQITTDYAGKEPILVGVLRGAFLFLADLVRNLQIPVVLDFMAVASYGSGTQTTGVVKILKDLEEDIAGRDVILVEDIIDTGLSLHYLTEILQARKPASLKTCVLLDKPGSRRIPIQADYVGFQIPNVFVVGYGLDYCQQFRHLPYIGVLKMPFSHSLLSPMTEDDTREHG